MFRYLGIFLLVVVIIKSYFINWQIYSGLEFFASLFWFCNFTAFVLGIALFLENKLLIKKVSSMVLVAAVPAQAIWIIGFILDFFEIYTFGRLGFISSYLLRPTFFNIFAYTLALLQHVSLIPVCIFLVNKLGFDKNILKTTLIFVVSLLLVSFLISNDKMNVNCMKHSCDVVSNYTNYRYDIIYLLKEIVSWVVIVTITFYFFRQILTKNSDI